MLRDLYFLNAFNVGLLEKMTAEIPAERWGESLANIPNHPAWQVGHLTFVRAALPAMLGKPGPVAVESVARFGPKSTPAVGTGANPGKAESLAAFALAQEHLMAVVRELDEAALAAPTPNEGLRGRFPTVRDALLGLLGPHDSLHLGQLGVWRSASGLPRIL
jgi:hypothetical protein